MGKPQGVKRAFGSPEFISGVFSLLAVGYVYSLVWQVQMIHYTDAFGFSPDTIGLLILGVPPILITFQYVTPYLTKRFGLIRCIYVSMSIMSVNVALVSLPAIQRSKVGFIMTTSIIWTWFCIAFNALNNTPPAISTAYTRNGLGVVTGMFTLAYNIGQGMGFLPNAIMYEHLKPWVTWLSGASFLVLAVAGRRLVLGLPLLV